MKFTQLPIGTRFRFRERTFRKVSPIEAVDLDQATRKIIPRSAKVVPVDDAAQPDTGPLPDRLSRDDVEAALVGFSAQLPARLQRLDPPLTDQQRAAVLTLVQSLRDDCMARMILQHQTANPSDAASRREPTASPDN